MGTFKTIENLLRLGIIWLLIATSSKALASATSLTYQGRILTSSGQPFEYGNASFLFKITSPDGQCVIYQEQFNGVDMTNSNGIFDVPIGTGSVQYIASPATTVIDIFNNNSASYQCGTCAPSGGNSYSCSASMASPYTASPADGRLLRVSFYDGSGWNTVTPDNKIRAVPYAGYSFTSYKLGSYTANDFMLKADVPASCGTPGNFLTWNSVQSKFTCSTLAAAGAGTITGVTANTGLTGGGTSGNISIALTNTGVTAGTYGSATQVPVISVDAQGRITTVVNTTITGAAPTGTASGDLSGNYPNPTIAGNAVTSAKILDATIVAADMDFTGTNIATSSLVIKDSSGKFAEFACSTVGHVASWTSVGWGCQAPSTADNTKLPLSGGTMAGAIDLNSNNIINIGYMTMSPGRSLHLSNNTSDPTGLGTADKGKMWFNATSNELKYWNGSAAVSAGASMDFTGTNASTTGIVLKDNTGKFVNFTCGTVGHVPTWTASGFACQAPSALLPSLNSGTLWIGNGSNAATPVTISGDATISNTGTLTLANTVTSGTYTKVTVDSKGRVTTGASLAAGDITAALTYTPVNKAGDVMTGSLGLGSFDNSTESSLVAGWGVADKGKTWFNTSTNQVKYWDGSTAQALGVSGAGLTSLNGQSGSAQTFTAPGNTGTAPAWISSSNSHTLNIPMASAAGVTAGLINKTDYDLFAAKQPAGNYLTALTGDVSASGPGSASATIGTGAVNSGKIADGSILGIDMDFTGTNAGTANLVIKDNAGKFVNFGCSTAGHVATWTVSGWSCQAQSASLPALNNGNIWVGNGSNAATAVVFSGDATLSNTGVLTLANTVTSGTYTKVTVDAKGRVTSGASLGSGDITGALTYTPVNKAGDVMTGSLGLGNYTDAAEATLVTGWTVADKGKTWFNSTSNQMKIWNGSSVQALGVAGAGLTSFNGETGSTQNLATPGQAGTAPTWSSSSNTHTLNIPLASGAGVTAGLISKSDYDAFSNKQASGNYLTALTGDVAATGPGSASATIANSAVTNVKMANMAANTLKGNNTGTSAAPTDITIASLQGTTATTFAAGNDSRITGALQSGTTAGGDLTGTYPNPAIASGAVTTGKIASATILGSNLNFSGVNTATTNMVLKDATGKFFDFGCSTAGHVATWTVSGWACQAITLSPSNFGSQTQNTFLAAPSGSSGNPTFRTIASADLPTTGATGVFTNGGNTFGVDAIIGTNDAKTLSLETNNSTQLFISATGAIGIGTVSPTSKLHVSTALTGNSGQLYTNFFYATAEPTAASTATYYGSQGTVANYNSNTRLSGATLTGLAGLIEQGGTGIIGNATAVEALISKFASGNMTNVYGVYSHLNSSTSGTVDSFRGLYVSTSISGTSTLTNGYGVYIDPMNGTTSSYGVYQSGASDRNYFAGRVGINTSSPSANAKLEVTGAIVSTPTSVAGASVNLSTSNTITLTAVGGSAITLSNMVHGGNYTLLVSDTTSRTYTFTGCNTSKFKPANTATVAGTSTMYNIITVYNGSTYDCWITWASGYQ